jgi:hypothetical protein
MESVFERNLNPSLSKITPVQINFSRLRDAE